MSYADCSKDEIMKLIDKGFTKSEIKGVCGRSEEKKNSKWFSPTYKKVTWKKAKEICKENGGRLPTAKELHKVVFDCIREAGISTPFHVGNSDYQSCYKNRGFIFNGGYWSYGSRI